MPVRMSVPMCQQNELLVTARERWWGMFPPIPGAEQRDHPSHHDDIE